jgi:hypothetical protein
MPHMYNTPSCQTLGALRQGLHFCTSKVSKLSAPAWRRRRGGGRRRSVYLLYLLYLLYQYLRDGRGVEVRDGRGVEVAAGAVHDRRAAKVLARHLRVID